MELVPPETSTGFLFRPDPDALDGRDRVRPLLLVAVDGGSLPAMLLCNNRTSPTEMEDFNCFLKVEGKETY